MPLIVIFGLITFVAVVLSAFAEDALFAFHMALIAVICRHRRDLADADHRLLEDRRHPAQPAALPATWTTWSAPG